MLKDKQWGSCFYCRKPLQKEATEVDQFIPFSRYSNDLEHYLLAAHRRCNHNKRDYMAAESRCDRRQLAAEPFPLLRQMRQSFESIYFQLLDLLGNRQQHDKM